VHHTLAAAVLAVLLSSSPARAQGSSEFGKQGSVSIAAERLFGVTHTSSSGSSVTTVSLLGGSGLELGNAPYSIPRIGVDYFTGSGLSLGLGAEIAFISTSSDGTVVGLNPRLGYAVRVSDGFSLWPRAGVSYVHLSVDVQSAYVLAATLEVQAVVTPFQHFGFTFSPTVDIGLAATRSTLTQLGLQAGMIGWF
jgi:hypothetical protein